MLTILFTLLLFSACASLICVAIHNLIGREGMLLSELGERLLLELPLWFCKPLFACLPCMASIWGSLLWIAYIVLVPFRDIDLFYNVLLVIPIVFMVSGLNTLADAVLICFNDYESDTDHELHK